MQINRPLKLKILLTASIFSGALIVAHARPAHANGGMLILGAAFIVTAYATMATICTPVAAIKASSRQTGFGDAFGDCFNWPFSSTEPDPAQGEPNQADQQTGQVKDPNLQGRLVNVLETLPAEDTD